MKSKFLGYMPDADPITEGVITDCEAMLPTVRGGMKGAPSTVSAGIAALSAKCYGAALGVKLDNTFRTFAGTLTKLYEANGSTWSDVTRASGGDYTLSTANRWRFGQFGNTSLAVNGADLLQYSNSGAFADVAGAPIAAAIDTSGGFVMLGGVDLGGGAGFEADRWICSAYNDYADWTPNAETECTTGRLVDAPGPITAVRKLGPNVVYYKERAMWLGTYQGTPDVWRFELIPGFIGASSQESVVHIGPAHIFVGYDDIYLFDGSRPVPISDGIKETFFADLNKKYRDQIIGSHDFVNSLVRFYYPSNASSSGAIDSCIVFNYKVGKWGRDDRAIEAAVEYLTGPVTYANIGDYFASYAAINVPYDSPFWTNTAPVSAIIDTAHTLYTLTGTSSASSLTTGEIGEDTVYSMLTRVTPRFINDPSSSTLINYYTNTSGSSYTTGATTTLANGRFDLLRSASWHKLKYNFTGDVEIAGHDVALQPDGEK